MNSHASAQILLKKKDSLSIPFHPHSELASDSRRDSPKQFQTPISFSDPFQGIRNIIEAAKHIDSIEENQGKAVRKCVIEMDSISTSIELNSVSTLVETPSCSSHPKQEWNSKVIQDMLMHIPVKGPFLCVFPSCGKTFKRKDNLKCHIKTHDSIRRRPFSCSLCDKSYLRQVDLSRHFDTIHTRLRHYPCGICDKSFTRKEGLQHHLKNKHN